MKTCITFTIIGTVILGFAACNSKVESSRNDALEKKADALDNKAAIIRKDSKVDANDQVKQASLDADAAAATARANAELEKKAAVQTADTVRQSGEQAAKALEEKATETRGEKMPVPEASATP